MIQYHALLKRIILNGEVQFEPRTQTYTIGLPGDQSIYDLRAGFPQMTTKNVPLRLPGEELFWKMRGERSVKPLFDRKVHIWDANAFDYWLKRIGESKNFPKHTPQWEEGFKDYCTRLATDVSAYELGDLGPVYGYQWRHGFKRHREEIDQLRNVVEGLKKNPGSRYHVMTAWNPSDLPDQAIGPCPMLHQFSAFGTNLHLHVYQRSCDTFLGVPFNISQDSLLLALVAKEVGFTPGQFVHSYGNTHIYLGVRPRADFWTAEQNVTDFKRRFAASYLPADFIGLKAWYEETAPPEDALNARKDHVPFVLEQLSKPVRLLPRLELRDIPLFEAIHLPVGEVAQLVGYDPHKWDAKAVMAA